MGEAAEKSTRVDEKVLSLDFECLRSLPEGINEVRQWYDNLLKCHRVGKRIDVSGMERDDVLPEASTLQSIDHRNVVPIVAAAQVSGYTPPIKVIELVTPYFERGSVTDALLDGITFTAHEAVAITQAALRGLGEIHEVYGICHRDMKSGNILLCTDASVARVADLGLAGRFDEGGHVPAVSNPTLYSPSEFATSGHLTRASDIYPMGLVLRELLGGAFPYATYTTTGIVERMSRGQSPLLGVDAGLPVWVSRSLRRIHRKATMKSPDDRYQQAAEMDAALARAVVVDWVQVTEHRWEAPFTHQSKRIAVEAKPRKIIGYRLSVTVNSGSGWRRIRPDVDVDDLTGPQTRTVFDQASDVASVR